MNDKIKRFTFYNIFFLCAFFSMFILLKYNSYADTSITVNSIGYQNENDKYEYTLGFRVPNTYRFCLYVHDINGWSNPYGISNRADLCCNGQTSVNYSFYSDRYIKDTNTDFWNIASSSSGNDVAILARPSSSSTQYYTDYASHDLYIYDGWGNNYISASGVPIFTRLSDVYNYLDNGVMPTLPYDDTLELDSFKVTSWRFGNAQFAFDSRFEVTWSDERISLVQVILDSTGGRISFESSSSPFKQKFEPENYVIKKGDVVHLTATPYKSDGSYGTSIYYSFIYDDNIPLSNIYRKFTNTPYSDNVLEIPYTGVSGNETVSTPVDGITTNTTYKVNYNPVTNEYGDLNVYEIYYSPVVVYEVGTPNSEIDETQDVVNNTYTTNNYYETTKNINIGFDVNFGDISGSDIQNGYDDFGNFSNGFGGFVGKLSSWILALFPFLSPVVASAIVFMFGLIILIAIIALVLKIVSVIADLIPL